MFRVIIKPWFAADDLSKCLLLESSTMDLSDFEVKELIVGIQFLFELGISSSCNPSVASIGSVLESFYHFQRCDQQTLAPLLPELSDAMAADEFPLLIDYVPYFCVDLYWDRDALCGPGQPERLWKKWIPKEIRTAILAQLEPELCA